MTTTARQTTAQIATDTTAIAPLVTLGICDDDFETCELCGHHAAELFSRIDNRDSAEVECCEHCADTADVSYCD